MDIKCIYHPTNIAVNKCEKCKKFICVLCIRKYVGCAREHHTYCTECYNATCQCNIL